MPPLIYAAPLVVKYLRSTAGDFETNREKRHRYFEQLDGQSITKKLSSWTVGQTGAISGCGRSRGTNRRLVRESLGVRECPQSVTTSATGELGTTVIGNGRYRK